MAEQNQVIFLKSQDLYVGAYKDSNLVSYCLYMKLHKCTLHLSGVCKTTHLFILLEFSGLLPVMPSVESVEM